MAHEYRESYHTVMRGRMQSMSSDERTLFREMNNMGGQGDGVGKMNRYGHGNSSGAGNQNRHGQGGGNGGGRRNR